MATILPTNQVILSKDEYINLLLSKMDMYKLAFTEHDYLKMPEAQTLISQLKEIGYDYEA